MSVGGGGGGKASKCGEKMVDHGATYACGLLRGHQGDHTDEYGLAKWPVGDPDFEANFADRIAAVRRHCPKIAVMLRGIDEASIDEPLREVELLIEALRPFADHVVILQGRACATSAEPTLKHYLAASAALGGEMPAPVRCTECRGYGKILGPRFAGVEDVAFDCEACAGTGRVP